MTSAPPPPPRANLFSELPGLPAFMSQHWRSQRATGRVRTQAFEPRVWRH